MTQTKLPGQRGENPLSKKSQRIFILHEILSKWVEKFCFIFRSVPLKWLVASLYEIGFRKKEFIRPTLDPDWVIVCIHKPIYTCD